jgi:flagellar biosynthesis/type III secretory pathway M-ring protein FliF/YscJ
VAHQLSVLAHDVFVTAFIDAMKTTLFVPIAFLAFTAVTTLLIRRRKRPAATQAEPAQEQKVATAAG